MLERLGPAPGEKSLAILLLAAPAEVQQEAVRAAELAVAEQRHRFAEVDEEVCRHTRSNARAAVPVSVSRSCVPSARVGQLRAEAMGG
jgi:hypothetical protein